jgi:hypothetical protein
VINVRWDVNLSHLLRICRCGMGDNNKKSEQTCAMFSMTDWGLNQQFMESLSWWLVFVSIQNVAESVIVGRWNTETWRFCNGVWNSTGGQSWYYDCHMVLRWNTSIFIALACTWSIQKVSELFFYNFSNMLATDWALSPSKYSPPALMHRFQCRCHFWEQPWRLFRDNA